MPKVIVTNLKEPLLVTPKVTGTELKEPLPKMP